MLMRLAEAQGLLGLFSQNYTMILMQVSKFFWQDLPLSKLTQKPLKNGQTEFSGQVPHLRMATNYTIHVTPLPGEASLEQVPYLRMATYYTIHVTPLGGQASLGLLLKLITMKINVISNLIR